MTVSKLDENRDVHDLVRNRPIDVLLQFWALPSNSMVICLSSIFSDPLDETGVAALTSLPRKDWAEVSVYPWKQQIRRRQVGTTPGGGGGENEGARLQTRGGSRILEKGGVW